MKVLITGINGFIGKHLARELFKRGHHVIGLGQNKKCLVDSVKKYYSGSVLDKKLVEKAMKDVNVVIHLAALTAHKDIIDNKFETLETNFLGTKNVLDSFVKSKTAKKFFYSSTGKVYGKIMALPISENHQTNPLNILGKSKLITEKLIDFYASASLSTSKKEFIIFRIFNMYGPSQKKNFLISTIFEQIPRSAEHPLYIKGGGGICEIVLGDIKAKRDYIFIDDLINAFVLAIEKEEKLGLSIYNICTGVGVSALEIVKKIGEIKGIGIKVKSDKTLLRDDEMPEEYGSYEKAKKLLGWEPKVSLEEGLGILCRQ